MRGVGKIILLWQELKHEEVILVCVDLGHALLIWVDTHNDWLLNLLPHF